MLQLKDRAVLITGAKGGLGTYVTKAFLCAGAGVSGVSRSIQASDFDHPGFHPVAAELAGGEAARKVVDSVLAKWNRLDAVVHLVGGFAGGKGVEDTDDATVERMLDMNFRSAFYIFRAALPAMRAQRSGRILAIGSRAAQDPQSGLAAY